MIITQSSFRQWLEENMDDHQIDNINRYGCDIVLTYDSDIIIVLWEHFGQEIWDTALGGRSLAEFAQGYDLFCLSSLVSQMTWAAAERLAPEINEDRGAA